MCIHSNSQQFNIIHIYKNYYFIINIYAFCIHMKNIINDNSELKLRIFQTHYGYLLKQNRNEIIFKYYIM